MMAVMMTTIMTKSKDFHQDSLMVTQRYWSLVRLWQTFPQMYMPKNYTMITCWYHRLQIFWGQGDTKDPMNHLHWRWKTSVLGVKNSLMNVTVETPYEYIMRRVLRATQWVFYKIKWVVLLGWIAALSNWEQAECTEKIFREIQVKYPFSGMRKCGMTQHRVGLTLAGYK